MKLPNGILIPDTVPDKHLLLPKIAGGAQMYMRIPNVSAQFEAPKQEILTVSGFTKPINLLSEDSPTLMEAWNITDIRVPCAIFINTTGKVKAEIVSGIFTLILRYGTDIVWSATEKISSFVIAQGSSPGFGFTLAQNFNNPIVVQRGRRLALEASGYAELASEVVGNLVLAISISSIVVPGVVSGQNIEQLSEGTITYFSQKHSGHRTL